MPEVRAQERGLRDLSNRLTQLHTSPRSGPRPGCQSRTFGRLSDYNQILRRTTTQVTLVGASAAPMVHRRAQKYANRGLQAASIRIILGRQYRMGARTLTRKVVLATVGSLGDLHPFIALGRVLRGLGVNAVSACSPEYRAKVEAAGVAHH